MIMASFRIPVLLVSLTRSISRVATTFVKSYTTVCVRFTSSSLPLYRIWIDRCILIRTFTLAFIIAMMGRTSRRSYRFTFHRKLNFSNYLRAAQRLRTCAYYTCIRHFGHSRFLFFYRRFNFFSLFIHVSRRLCFNFLFLFLFRLQILLFFFLRFNFLWCNFLFRLFYYRFNLFFLSLLLNRFYFWLRRLRRHFLHDLFFLGCFLWLSAFKAIQINLSNYL